MPASDPCTLIYLLYGDREEYHLELSYSVLSAVRQAGSDAPPRIVLFTDEKGRRDDLPVEHHVFSAEDFARWTNQGSYNHGAKIGALITAMDTYPGKVALIDTDTFFLAAPGALFDRIDPNAVVMQADEGTLAVKTSSWDGIFDHFARHECEAGPIDRSSRMFNSGVVGLDSSVRPLLDAIPPLTHRLHALAPRVHDVDQFAITHVLGAKLELRACDDIVHHYWGYERRFIHARIKRLLPEFTREAFEAALQRPWERIDGFPPKRKFDVIKARFKGLVRREQPAYRWAYLAYLSALSESRRDISNAWAATALDAINYNEIPARSAARDFRRLREGPGSRLDLLDPPVRDRWRGYWQGLHTN